MNRASRSFQVFAKPAGARCNMACRYCYYLEKDALRPKGGPGRMPEDLLEAYIVQHIDASPDDIVRFSWHGGEPTVLGLDYFRRIVEVQRKHRPPERMIANGMQTNGTLLDEEWGRFLAAAGFSVGLSLDGPRELNDHSRVTREGKSAFEGTMRGYDLLRLHRVPTDILCVVGAHNVRHPAEVYRFFKSIGASYVTFLPLVDSRPGAPGGVGPDSVAPETWGDFLRTVFDEWVENDIGRIKIQIFEEAARTAFGLEHSLCVFRPVCGDIPIVELDGDVYSCDHFVDAEHRLGNIRETPLVDILESTRQRDFGEAKMLTLPRSCLDCEVLEMCHGECPKNRFILTPEGDPGLNYLCEGYKAFFSYCRPFIEAVAAAWRRQDPGPG